MDFQRQDEVGGQGDPCVNSTTCTPCNDENCCCNSGTTSRCKSIIFATVMLLAVAVAAYSMVKKNVAASSTPSAPASRGDNNGGHLSEIRLESVEAAEKLATGHDVTFLLLPGQDASSTQAAREHVSTACGKLIVQGQKSAAFTLPGNAGAYKAIMERFRVAATPCVVVLGNGGRPSAIAGEITEAKLLSAAVMAGLRSNCCPGGSCCPGATPCLGPAFFPQGPWSTVPTVK